MNFRRVEGKEQMADYDSCRSLHLIVKDSEKVKFYIDSI